MWFETFFPSLVILAKVKQMSAQLDTLNTKVAAVSALVEELIVLQASGTSDAGLQPAIDALTVTTTALNAALGR